MQHEKNTKEFIRKELIKKLKKLGYKVGSHIRLTTEEKGLYHITIPNHSPLKIGTLSSILSDIAAHFNEMKDDLIERLF